MSMMARHRNPKTSWSKLMFYDVYKRKIKASKSVAIQESALRFYSKFGILLDQNFELFLNRIK